jgi:hypothetical protein
VFISDSILQIQVSSFGDLRSLLANESLADRLATVYETVDDIDLLVGVMAERPRKGGGKIKLK